MRRPIEQQARGRWQNGATTWLALLLFAVLAALLLGQSLLPSHTLVPLRIIQNIAPWEHLDLGPRGNRLVIDPFFIFYPNLLIM